MDRISNLKASVGMLIVLTALGLVNSVSAVDIYWTNAYAWSVLWRDAENWNPMVVPGATDTAFISPQYCAPPDRGPAVDPMCNVQVFAIHGPRYDSALNQVMDITGGTIDITDDWRWAREGTGTATINISGSPIITICEDWRGVDHGTGILNISGTPLITVAGRWRVADADDAWVEIYVDGGTITADDFKFGDDGGGIVDISGGDIYVTNNWRMHCRYGAQVTMNLNGGTVACGGDMPVPADDGTCTVNMTGGTVTVGGHMEIGGPMASTGRVNLHGGVINTHTFGMCALGGTGTMDIETGVMIVDGNVVPTIQQYVSDGWITAYGGIGDFIIDFNTVNPGKTTVLAVSNYEALPIDDPLPAFEDPPSPWHNFVSQSVITYSFQTSWNGIGWTDEQKAVVHSAMSELSWPLPEQRFEEGASDFTTRWSGADFFRDRQTRDANGNPSGRYRHPGWYLGNEPYTDTNGNGRRDPGEPYTDENGDGRYTRAPLAVAYKHNNGPWDHNDFPNNEIYFNRDYPWSFGLFGVDPNKYDFWTVAMHEIIHMLACDDHAAHPNEVMYRSIERGQRKWLQETDLDILRAAGYDANFVREGAAKCSPYHRAEDVPSDATVSWLPGKHAASHDVYFATSWDDVNNANKFDLTGIYRGPNDVNIVIDPCDPNNIRYSYSVPESLDLVETYFWRVDEVNDPCTWKGDVWRFTTANYLVVHDFESYGHGEEILIWDTWIDGYWNDTGSWIELGIEPCAPVHGGNQSMIYDYDNSVNNGAGYYSEIEADTADLQVSSDWTIFGVKALTLYFYGDPDNDANDTEQMYVGLEDSSGASSYAEVSYGEDMSDVKIAEWHEWNIRLQDFNDGGVELTDVNRVFIGFGDRDEHPVPGGSGIIYFDDIRLYLPRCISSLLKPIADLSGNCVVDVADIGIMALDWLETEQAMESPANLYDKEPPQQQVINSRDFAVLMEGWLDEKLWPPP